MNQAARKSNLFTVALVGAAALKGKEVRDVLSERNFPSIEIKLLDEEDALGQLDQVNDEPTFIQGVSPEHLEERGFRLPHCRRVLYRKNLGHRARFRL